MSLEFLLYTEFPDPVFSFAHDKVEVYFVEVVKRLEMAVYRKKKQCSRYLSRVDRIVIVEGQEDVQNKRVRER